MGTGSFEQELSTLQPVPVNVAHIDSLEEITHWLGTFRERLRQARATERDGIIAVVDRLEDRYRLRRAELS